MTDEQRTTGMPADLRQRAEEVLGRQPQELRETPPEDLQDLIHELQVHQVELEMQNEELRRAQRELKQAHDEYSDLYDFAPVGYVTLNKNGSILKANLTAARMLGVEKNGLVDQPLPHFIAREDQDAFYLHRRQVFQTQGPQTAEFRMVAEHGSELWVRMEATLTGHKGDQATFRATLSDISDEKAMEEKLRQQDRLAAVGQLAGGIAHDFNNILASIILHAEMSLDRSGLTPKTRKALRTILLDSRRGADLVQQILDFSRNAMMDTEPANLVTLVQETLTFLRRTLPEHIRLVTEIDSLTCTIEADRTRIHQVLMNLAFNARDAMPEGGELRIGVQGVTFSQHDRPAPDMVPGAWARLTVTDTGTGMNEEVQDHLFEPFFTTKEVGKGTGLGLAQVHGIVKQHHGFIDVATAPGDGTTVTIFFPLVEDTPKKPTPTNLDSQPHPQDVTILVVEDADSLRAAIRAGLETLGHRVIGAAHGREALDVVSSHDIDLVITDLVMPNMGGEGLLRHLREQNSSLKVIAMTGHITNRDVQRLKDTGFSDALPKPFSIEQLIATIGDVMST